MRRSAEIQATSTQAPADEPRFVAAACQVRFGRPYSVLDTAYCHEVVGGTGSRTLAEAEEYARRLNAWDADEQVAWPLGLS